MLENYWVTKLRVGDYVATCEGHNRRIEQFHVTWRVRRGVRYVSDIDFRDSFGGHHSFGGPGGCVHPKETPEQVTAYFKGWIQEALGTTADEYVLGEEGHAQMLRMHAALQEGRGIVDEFGQLLREFDRNHRGGVQEG